jgi:2-oxoglutarate dehydrogenase E2 component (dihydrolipoamide succinyltransferase)
MPTEVIMPQLGESVIEGTVTKWLKSPGEPVKEYEPLLEVNTDKVDTEIPSTATGTLLEILVPEGTTVRAGAILARIGEADENLVGEKKPPEEHPRSAGAVGAEPAAGAASAARAEPAAVAGGKNDGARSVGNDPDLGFISPVVARIAQENHIDLARVKGTGLGGRITKNDVLAYLEDRKMERPAEPPVTSPAVPAPSVSPAPSPTVAAPVLPASLPGEVVPLTAVRRAIAEHMVMSKRTSPHVTTVMEADMSRVAAHRQASQASFERDGARLTYTAYFVAAAVAALKAYPTVNSSWSEAGVVLHRPIHIGVAASLGEEGLIVPVLKNADSLSLLGIARSVNDLANRARAHKLQPNEVKGGTFTITNHGTSGSLFATPIINQPQSAILGVGKIQKRVMVVETPDLGDTIAIRPMIYLTLTFDHRILDGAAGDAFLGKVVEILEKWK